MTEQYTKYWELFIRQKANMISPSERGEFEAWIESDTKHKSIIQGFENIFKASASEDNVPSFDPRADWEELQTMIKIDVNNRIGWSARIFPWITRIAAAVILILGFTFIFYQYKKLTPDHLNLQTMVQTDDTNQKIIDLPDGTTVWLNKNSELLYPEEFSGEKRTIYLKGEAFFEVTSNEKKPFIVHSGISKTTVLGTSFNLRAYSKEDEVKLTVVTGKVAFTLADGMEGVIVTSGNMAVLINKSKSIVQGKNTDLNFLSWKTRLLIFNDCPMQDLIKTLERHYGTSITVKNPETLSCRFTGDFQDTNLENTIKIITRATGTSYEISEGQYIIQGEDNK